MSINTARPWSRIAAAGRHGIGDALSLAPAIVPLGLALGVAFAETEAPRVVSWASAPLLVAGSSQLVLLTQLDAGAAVLTAVLAAVLINGRFVLYGADLARRFADQPHWFRWLGPHYIVDQTYGLVTSRLNGKETPDEFRRYFMASGTLLWLVWSSSVGLGVLAGPALPSELHLEFVLPAMFIALVVPGLERRSELFAAIGGVGLAMTSASAGAAVLAAVAVAVAICAVDRRVVRS